MKNLNLILVTILLSVLANFNNANACSVRPLDPLKQAEKLEWFAILALDLSGARDNLLSVTASEAEAEYIWTDMCPEGITAKATFTVKYETRVGDGNVPCAAVYTVDVVEKNCSY